MKLIQKMFVNPKPIIGMIHSPPLIGYPGYPGITVIRNRIAEEAKILEKAGIHGIIVENNYDIPHKEFVDTAVGAIMTMLVDTVVSCVSVPVGVSVLWNDYKTALGICAATGASFIRVPAFVDDVRTKYGDMIARADEVVARRKLLDLDNKVAILADVQVKHSEMIDKNKTLATSVRQAIKKEADAIIITGKWTGDAPILGDLQIAKRYALNLPVLVGSGSNVDNLSDLLRLCDGIIVGTAIMNKGVVNRNKIDAYMRMYKQLSRRYNKEAI